VRGEEHLYRNEDKANGELTDNKGEELGIETNRPVDSLKWVNNNTLSYERWTGPHLGRRYVVDVKLKKQTGAFILSDQ